MPLYANQLFRSDRTIYKNICTWNNEKNNLISSILLQNCKNFQKCPVGPICTRFIWVVIALGIDNFEGKAKLRRVGQGTDASVKSQGSTEALCNKRLHSFVLEENSSEPKITSESYDVIKYKDVFNIILEERFLTGPILVFGDRLLDALCWPANKPYADRLCDIWVLWPAMILYEFPCLSIKLFLLITSCFSTDF